MNQENKNIISEYLESSCLDQNKRTIVFEETSDWIQERLVEEEFQAWAGDEGRAAQKIRALSQEQLEQFNKEIIDQSGTRKLSENFYVIDSNDVDAVINQIISEKGACKLPSALYDNINPSEEFGVSRFIADRVARLGGLLNKAEVIDNGERAYKISATDELNQTSRLSFEYRFTAGDEASANEIANHLVQQLNGIMRKIWLAAWKIGGDKKKTVFGVSILQLLRACNPGRESNFGAGEIEQFYQTLKSMEPAHFILEKNIGPKNKKGRFVEDTIKYNISLLKVIAEKGEKNKTPDSVLIHLFDVSPFPAKEKTKYVGMPVKRKTLELHAKDVSFAMWLQTRINQLCAGGEKKKDIKYYDFPRSVLIEAANLQKTDASNSRMANKILLKKLSECKQAGILSKTPVKIKDPVQLCWI